MPHKDSRKRCNTRELREQLRGSHFEKEDSPERELCMEKKIKRREYKVLLSLREIISVCVCESKEK